MKLPSPALVTIHQLLSLVFTKDKHLCSFLAALHDPQTDTGTVMESRTRDRQSGTSPSPCRVARSCRPLALGIRVFPSLTPTAKSPWPGASRAQCEPIRKPCETPAALSAPHGCSVLRTSFPRRLRPDGAHTPSVRCAPCREVRLAAGAE